MFDAPLPDANTSFLSPTRRRSSSSIGDKTRRRGRGRRGPAGEAARRHEARGAATIKLLRFDPNQPASQAALKTYFPATVRAASYPNLLPEDVPRLAVKAFLVTYDYNLDRRVEHLPRFARSLCRNFVQAAERRATRSGARSISRCRISAAAGATTRRCRARSTRASPRDRAHRPGRRRTRRRRTARSRSACSAFAAKEPLNKSHAERVGTKCG